MLEPEQCYKIFKIDFFGLSVKRIKLDAAREQIKSELIDKCYSNFLKSTKYYILKQQLDWFMINCRFDRTWQYKPSGNTDEWWHFIIYGQKHKPKKSKYESLKIPKEKILPHECKKREDYPHIKQTVKHEG